jgi:hypothetical protein
MSTARSIEPQRRASGQDLEVAVVLQELDAGVDRVRGDETVDQPCARSGSGGGSSASVTNFGSGVRLVTEPRSEPYARVVVFLDIAGNRWDLLGPR